MGDNGATLQLVSKGRELIYFTGTPKADAFEYSYQQYYDFAKELVELNVSDKTDFGKSSYVIIPKGYGHLLSSMYLSISLPALVKKSGTFASWSNTLGYALFKDSVELEIGDHTVDRCWPEYQDIKDELNVSDQKLGLDNMILKSDLYTASQDNASKPVNLVIPLNFFFTSSLKMSLPVCCMSEDIKIKFNFKPFEELINYDGEIPPDPVKMQSVSLFAEYIYLDQRLIQKFLDKPHRYVIQQTLFSSPFFVNSTTQVFQTPSLPFFSPCKEIIIVAKDSQSIANNDHFNYQRPIDSQSIIKTIGFYLDNKRRFNDQSEEIYRTITCKNTHNVIPTKSIYVIPFCEKPAINQPNGYLNLGCFKDAWLKLGLDCQNDTSIYVYANCINIFTVKDGKTSLEFLYL